jgi:membrane-associated protein
VSPLLFGLDWLDPQALIDSFGRYALWGVLFILFAECGLLIGFFLPGDSLLFTVGLLISQSVIGTPLWLACLLMTLAAIAGNVVGYAIGARAGPAILSRPDSRLFKQSYVDKTRLFFDKYGNRAIVLARFVPIVRTFITVVAGMSFRRFVTYSAIGGVLWATGVTLLGYYLGQIALVREHIELMLLAIVAVSVLPIVFELLRVQLTSRSSREKAQR